MAWMVSRSPLGHLTREQHAPLFRLISAIIEEFGSRPRRYSVFFEVRADLAWVARSISGGGCCSPAIAHQTLT
jgi:hypothetical protein